MLLPIPYNRMRAEFGKIKEKRVARERPFSCVINGAHSVVGNG